MLVLTLLGGVIALVVLAFRWLSRRWDNVDSYYEREYQDPPISDLGSYLGGDRL
jgi:hypothetical protein